MLFLRWPKLLICPLCRDTESGLNEIHLLFICREMEDARLSAGIEEFLGRRQELTAAGLYYEFWKTTSIATLKRRITAAEKMRKDFLERVFTCAH